MALTGLARAHRELGEIERAGQRVDAAVSVARERRLRHFEGLALLEQARLLAARDGRDAVPAIRSLLEHVGTLVEQMDARSFVPRIRELEGLVARLLGDTERWCRQLEEARRLDVAMGATGHAERLARELAS